MKSRTKSRPPGRPITFERDDIVQRAMDLFWCRGFRNVSLSEIAEEVGLTRASVYNSFESKEALFLEALDRYAAAAPEAALAVLSEDQRVKEALDVMFSAAARAMANDKDRRGCLAMNCSNEMMASDTPVGQALLSRYKSRRRIVKTLVERAVRTKELPADTNPEITANLIVTFLSGLSVFSKSGVSEATLVKMSRAFLKQLGFSGVKRPIS